MARKRRGRRGGFKIPIISTAIVVGQVLAARAVDSSPLGTFNHFQELYTGINFQDGSFHPERLILGYAPWLVKRFAMPIARPRMPLRGLPISLS